MWYANMSTNKHERQTDDSCVLTNACNSQSPSPSTCLCECECVCGSVEISTSSSFRIIFCLCFAFWHGSFLYFFMASKSKNIAWVKCWPVLANSYCCCCCCSWWSKMYGVWEEVHARARMCRKKKETIDSIDRSSKGKKERINKWKEKNRTHAHKRAKRKEVIMNRWLLRFVRSFVGFVQISITSRLENYQRTGFSSLFTFLFANAYSHILTMSLPSPSSSSSSCLCKWIGRCQLAPHLSFVYSTLFFLYKVRSHTHTMPVPAINSRIGKGSARTKKSYVYVFSALFDSHKQ